MHVFLFFFCRSRLEYISINQNLCVLRDRGSLILVKTAKIICKNRRKSLTGGQTRLQDTLYTLYTYLPTVYHYKPILYIDLYHLETTWFRARVIIFGSTSYIFIIGFERLCCTRMEYIAGLGTE